MKISAKYFTVKSLLIVSVLMIICGAAVLKFAPIGSEKNKMENKMENKFSEADFEDVSENSYMSYECSPESDDLNFLGIMLNAPKVVKFVPGYPNPINGTWARIIVCGMYSFKYTTLGLNGDFADAITLIAVDEKTKISYRGRMSGVMNEIPEPQGKDNSLSAEDFSGDTIGGYFNPNLAHIMSLPEQEADYTVYAQLGPYESNRVKISVRKSDQK